MSDPKSRIPPHSERIEVAFIGCALCNADIAVSVAQRFKISSISFYIPKCKILWEAIESLYVTGKPVDILSVSEHLRQHGKLNLIGGRQAVESCLDEVSTATAAEYYAKEIARYAKLRKIIDVAREHAIAAYEMDADPHAIASKLDLDVAEILELLDDRPLHEIASELLDEWRNPSKTRAPALYIPWRWISRACGALDQPLIYIAGLPSSGKTAMSVNLAVANARRGVKVLYASLESNKRSIARRFIAHMAKVNCLQLQSGNGTTELWARARNAVQELAQLPLTLSDKPMTDAELRAWARAEKAKGKCDVLIIDNLKHIQPSMRYSSEPERFKAISERIKWMRDELRVPVVVLHHLNDEGKMAWSRDIQRDADVILSLEPLNNDTPTTRSVTVTIAKNRDAIDGIAETMVFHKDVQTFCEHTEEPEIPAEPMQEENGLPL